ncbi:MAG: 4-(cytidine 5'-diphospho)-2-C-methyl-D-erythritol kinase [Candidatus Limnocylindrales bacterium]|jgi:4-diphosphocytidyl-2-C-methyl-D-erythritol kinase
MSAAAQSAPARVRVLRFAPAKLNLTLAVVGRREDGFHALHSVMVALALSDAVALSPAAARGAAPGDTLRIAGLPLPATPDNLVLLAIAATRDAVGATWPGVPADPPPLAARLTKRIPVAAGLGGGSSDAAATMAAALEAWGAALPAETIRDVAASLGSDVPFFIAGGAALVTGRGELVEPLPDLQGEAPAVLIVTPRLAVSTPAVFAAYASGTRPATALAASERLAADLRAGLPAAALLARAEELAAANDLLPAALEVAPALVAFRRALHGILGRPVGQSGSGPSAWALYPSLPTARKAARFLRLAIREGSLPPIGDGEPFVAVSTMLASGRHTTRTDAHNGGRTRSKGR